MQKISEPLAHPSLDQQLIDLNNVIEQVLDFLFQARHSGLPPTFDSEADRLANSLTQICSRVSQLEEERQNLRALADFGHSINASFKLDMLLPTVMDTIIRISKAERGFLMIRDPKGGMAIQVARNFEQGSYNPTEYSISRSVVNRVIMDVQPVLTTHAESEDLDQQDSLQSNSLRSILCVPMMLKNKLIGIIYADKQFQNGPFSQRDLNLITELGEQAAIALENARLFESIQRTLAEATALSHLLDNVLGSIPSAVLTLNRDGVITVCNSAAGKMLGMPCEEVTGRRLVNIAPGLLRTLQSSLVSVLNTNQAVIKAETSHTFARGVVMNLRYSISPLQDNHETAQGVTIVLEDLTEKKSLEAKRRLFERMVSPAVIAHLEPDSVQLGGRRAVITVLFADLRDFTSFSETVPPEELVRVLNRHLSAAVDAVLVEGGTVDKFLGDAVMAWFNAPVLQPDHTLRAARAALGIRRAIASLHEELPTSQRLSFGVGIHIGEAVLGLVGSEQRLDYTAVGDCVNTARRLQESAVHGQILISQAAYQRMTTQVQVRRVDPIHAKGKSGLLQAYELLGLS